MDFRRYTPAPPLQHWVSRIMISRFDRGIAAPVITLPFPPQPEHCLYFYPEQRIVSHNHSNGIRMQMPGAMLVGPQLSRVDLTMGSRMLVIMVGFRPGALHRLLRIPMHELLNLPLDAKLIFGSEVDDVSEQLQGATGFAQMVEIVERFLLRKSHLLKPALPLEAVLANLKAEGPISQLAAQACVSIRQLERQFNERIGMTPKTYARLLRFSRAWILHERFPQLPWISIAHSCHYADQMHLIRDFKAFTGVSPRQLQGPDADSLRLQAETFD